MDTDDVDIIACDRVFDGYSQLDAYRLRHRLFEGGWTGEISRELLDRGPVVCVLPYDPVRDEVVLIEQFRIGAYGATLPPWQLKIVAGVVEDGETAEEVARRETVEECGCEILALHFAGRGLSSSGILSEVATLYCGIVNSSGAGGVHGVAGEGEDIRARVHSFDTAMKMIEEDAFHHMHGIAVLHWLNAHRDKLRGETP